MSMSSYRLITDVSMGIEHRTTSHIADYPFLISPVEMLAGALNRHLDLQHYKILYSE